MTIRESQILLELGIPWSLVISHVAVATQLFESVFAFLVLSATGAFRGFGVPQFLDYFRNGFRVRLDGAGARGAAEAAVAFSFSVREIKRNDRHVLAVDVLPHVQLGPVEQRVDADMR